MRKRVLIVEDEMKVSRLLQLELTHEGYEVEIADNGKEALSKASTGHWDIILLDIMLPEMTGSEVLRRIRKSDLLTPIIVLTARNTTSEKVSGLDLGANDYMTKPFEIEELLARMRACIRNRTEDVESSLNHATLNVSGLSLNKNTRDVIREGQVIDLTPKEYDLLLYLMENKNHVLEREQIITHVWGYDFQGETNIVDVYVRYLRKKVDLDFRVKLIQTIRGVGYCMRDERS
ncbi:response regulator transcription factor [Paenibacillus aurantiacus]|uniref:Response regulator transcription factor n=1 Tax=Paenibacillus aurantiacus TaxID=1936118 RepID=A0ABV5KUT8_9BACL